LALLLVATSAQAQVVETPPDDEVPWGQNVSGFMSVALGLIYLPQFGVSATPSGENFRYQAREGVANFPNFSAHLAFIPAFGNNGVAAEVGYEIMSMRWRQTVSDDANTYGGHSTLALTFISLSINYLRYFLEGADRVYLLAGGGYVWERARLSTETGGQGSTDDSGFPNWRVNTGFGYLHETHAGAIGFEIRADLPLLQSRLNLTDPYGPYQVKLTHPLLLRLAVTLMVGRLRSTTPTHAGNDQ
jgi:hypothetical protein